MKVGVLALQGAFREHRVMLEDCGAEVVEVRKKTDLEGIQGLVIPGGESTTIGKLLNDFGIMETLKEMGEKGFPIYGSCAGMILLSKEIVGTNQPRLGLMDIVVKRNAYGRQVDSFEAELPFKYIEGDLVKGVFIRAPYIESVGKDVEVMCEFEGNIVAAKQGNLLATSFHPELTTDSRIHKYFISLCKNSEI